MVLIARWGIRLMMAPLVGYKDNFNIAFKLQYYQSFDLPWSASFGSQT